jgi:uncharacterized protein involved in type VI secretion and phage assembly
MTQFFFGKYRGTVTNNVDPENLGRLQVQVPAVLGEGRLSWAMPCVPFAGPQIGFFALPPINANVWVEFEAGDPDFPIWSGCFWGKDTMKSEVPQGAGPGIAILKTQTATISIDDKPGANSLTIETITGMKLVFDNAGITIDNGQGGTITLSGPQVSLNNGALEVI